MKQLEALNIKRKEQDLILCTLITVAFIIFSITVQMPENVYTLAKTFDIPESHIRVIFLALLLVMLTSYKVWIKARKNQLKWGYIMDSICPDVFLLIDSKRNILMCSNSVLRMFGYKAEEVIGNKTDFLYGDRRTNPKSPHEIYDALEVDGYHVGLAVGRHKSGSQIPIEIVTGKLTGHPGAVLLLRDIAERQHPEDEREFINAVLDTKNKSIEKVLMAFSNNFRTPLMNINGFGKEVEQSINKLLINLKDEDVPKDVAKKISKVLENNVNEALEYILMNISKIDTLLDGFIEVSRIGKTEIELKKLNVNELISDVVDRLGHKLSESEIEIDVSNLPPCFGDAGLIRRVFTNLIDNALKYLDPGRKGIIRISGRTINDEAVYCVQDNGVGIPMELQQKIFKIFYQVDSEKAVGEGLGLALVQRIVEKHMGKIWLESNPGAGSKFFVSIPTEKKE
ncbi:PAS domain S-box protein [bacterium]|nr:PAS domain S-box protein [bacterium]